MQTAIATVCLSGTLNEKLEVISGARFESVEIFEPDLLSFNGAPRDVRVMMDGLGLKAAVFQPFRDFEGMPDPQRTKAFARAERKFDVMQELGCDFLMICSNVSPDSLGGIDRAAADLRELGERAAKRGVRVGFEALSWGRHINDYRDAWEAVRRADHPQVGLVLDSFHILARKTDLGAIRSIPRDRIFLVQMADAPLLELDYLNWSRHYRSFPGQGDLPLSAFMDALQATDYDGLLSLEIFSDRFRAGSARSLAIDGRRSLLFLLDELRRRSGKPSTVALPPRSRCERIEFLEFALDEKSKPDFETTVSALGFTKVGEHRSKAVTRWRQGDVNLVLNSEAEGFAHSYNLMHGSAVCAMALKVEDAAATMDRAVALLDQPFHQQVGPDELNIPAVRGLGGSLIYFVDAAAKLDRLWDVDFTPAAENGRASSDAGLISIDHIQHAMGYGEMLTWILFYCSLFDLGKTPLVEVVDPGGVTQSQVVESRDGRMRLAMNASQSQHTLASRFLSDFFGSGVHHVAFATTDILHAAVRLRENGIEALPISENYYDDLETRTDLSSDEIAKLREYNILYDSDAQGSYLQLYTRTLLRNGFFFEIVERRGNYRGYGGVNAPVRLAAQTQLTHTVVD